MYPPALYLTVPGVEISWQINSFITTLITVLPLGDIIGASTPCQTFVDTCSDRRLILQTCISSLHVKIMFESQAISTVVNAGKMTFFKDASRFCQSQMNKWLSSHPIITCTPSKLKRTITGIPWISISLMSLPLWKFHTLKN